MNKMSENNLWGKFDESIDVAGLAEDVKESEKNGSTNYREVPHGEYEVSIEKMELGESKKHDPMLSIWFKILEGEYKGSLIFFNQVVNQGFQIHIVNDLIRSMDVDVDTDFVSYNQYGNMLMDAFEQINGNLEFALKYGEGKKGFSTYEITEVFEVEK